MPLSNLEIHWIVRELQPLTGVHFDKISDLESGWKLKFGSHEVIADVPEKMYMTMHRKSAREPRGFTQYVRKHLHGKVECVYQPGFDRVVVFGLDSGQKLAFELFAHGNAVLIGADGTIEKTFRDEEWSARKIKRGEVYLLPPSEKLDPREMTKEQFDALFGKKDVIRSLVAGIKMSGKYLELACIEAGVDKSTMRPNEKLREVIQSYLESYTPGIQGGVPVVQRFPGPEFIPKKSFSEALDECYAEITPDRHASEKVKRKIEQQGAAINELERKAGSYNAAGDAIYANWKALSELVDSIKSWREEGLDYDSINKKLAGKASINKKTQRLTVKL